MTNSLANDAEFDELQQLTLEAKDRLSSGEGGSGMHYELIALLSKYCIFEIELSQIAS